MRALGRLKFYQVAAKEGGHIHFGQLKRLSVVLGLTSAENCEIVELVNAKRCLPSTFYIIAKDQFGNRRKSGGDSLEVVILEGMDTTQYYMKF